MSLSDKGIRFIKTAFYEEKYVKEFIKELKGELMMVLGRGAKDPRTFIDIIDKKAGEKLT